MSMTINDIAQACGLSRATVSRALRNSPKVSAKSKKLVDRVVKETGYRPNQMAQSLAQGYVNTVALIVGNISSNAQVEIAKSIQKGLYEEGFMVWLCNSDYNTSLCDAYIDAAVASRLAGVILVTADATPQKLQSAAEELPVVLVNRQDFAIPCDSVLGNDQKAAYQAVCHLTGLGHRNIALLGSSRTMITSRNAYFGYQMALEANGVPFREDSVYEIDICSYSDALKPRAPFDAGRLFREHPEVSAVICTCNEIAVEFFIQCKKIGKSIPLDLSMVCLDPVQTNWFPEISLCTFGADQWMLGEAAVEQILSRIREHPGRQAPPASSANVVLEPTYIEGNSVRKIQ